MLSAANTVMEQIVTWMFVAFMGLACFSGVAVLTLVTLDLVLRAMNRLLCVASLLEALREAHKQGRAPIYRTWKWFDDRHG